MGVLFIIVICWMFNLYAAGRSLGLDSLLWRQTPAAKGGGLIAPFIAGLLSVRLKGRRRGLGSWLAFCIPGGIFRSSKSGARPVIRRAPRPKVR